MDSKEYEIAQTLVNLNDSQRKNSTDAIIDKNIYLFSEFQNYAHTPSTSLTPPRDCLIQLAPIRTLVHEEEEEEENKRANEKPRWSNPMKNALLEAVIEQKELSDMATFNWAAIGKQVGRSGKACKDQWRRAILPKLQQLFEDE